MSHTTSDSGRRLHAVPAPEQQTGLTGAPAAIYTELTSLTQPATVAELALAAGVGRSTAGKALVTLEEHGLAVRTPGGHDGPRRTPDRWNPAHTNETGSDDETAQAQGNAQPDRSAADTPDPATGDTTSENTTADETAPITPIAPDDEITDPATGQAPDTPQDTQSTKRQAIAESEGSDNAPVTEEAPAPQKGSVQKATSVSVATTTGEKKRLVPGALRQLVTDHLAAHPGEAFTATKISRVIEKSSGAIANALVTLVKQGIAEQVSDQPRTYRRAEATPASTE
ncbi:helix-turn-helix domain-containing protein [Streptomyces sp. 35G-GA-8]|uniref:helix-turn-helix domain-containing protein n=1 Tax=Streptomyces sp. 35G-GA-8 TaxID=2939434 RepID=UPI00201F290F|nr:helix-turn-helix domain-containing protein [Streptomyces sp. 35G-GA-8]MCL7377035.1 MarR family transcriptional regulator [Streptomyces sp. 35G-GA-8]